MKQNKIKRKNKMINCFRLIKYTKILNLKFNI